MTDAHDRRAHLVDSTVFGHLWSTDASRSIFGEQARLQRWVGVIAALGRAQATLGIIPQQAADEIDRLVGRDLDLDAIGEHTRATSHSTLGLIRVLQTMLPDPAREYVYYGTTVQDITDTSMMLEIGEVGSAMWDELLAVETALLDLAQAHRSTPMVGRTHGQPGAPITFGFKAASWADEIGRCVGRLGDARGRVLAVQLGGAVGSLGFFGADALALRAAFADEIGLPEPSISWLTARDRLGEFASIVALAVTALARIANEVYSLQRREIGELSEDASDDVVGSITMPHKRNPESSEQIVVLARLVRAHAATLADTMVQEHERDARGWKAEWVVFPELCHYAMAAVSMSRALVDGLQVHVDTMRENLVADSLAGSEQVLRRLSPRLGKHRAQDLLNQAYRRAAHLGDEAAVGDLLAEVTDDADLADLADLVELLDVDAAATMVDRVVEAARRRRAEEPPGWP